MALTGYRVDRNAQALSRTSALPILTFWALVE